jgi:gas vesicle protein
MQENVEFDIDTAIKVLRQSGYFKQALELCEKHQKYEDYLKIQLEHLSDYNRALSFISKLDSASAVFNLKKYGKLLMAKIPEKTVEFLKKICSNCDAMNDKFLVDPAEFLHIFLKNSDELINFLENIHKNKKSNSKVILNTLLELYINSFSNESLNKETNLPLKNKLPEILTKVDDEKRVSFYEKRALEFLTQNYTLYDMNLALVICQLHNFKAGMLYLYEKNGMYQRILQYHMNNNEYTSILDTCKRYGTQDSNLWIQALQYFSKREEFNCKEYIMQILANIEKFNLLTPLMVIKILSKNSTLTVDTVKEFLLKRMRKEEKEIEQDQETVNRHLKSIMELKNQIDRLKTEPIIFQANKCKYCDEELNFPSIHCLCNHSFHAECFENHSVDDACPTCATENSNFMNLIKQNEESKKNLHDAFHKELERKVDKFEVIADYLGKGLFNKVTLITEN